MPLHLYCKSLAAGQHATSGDAASLFTVAQQQFSFAVLNVLRFMVSKCAERLPFREGFIQARFVGQGELPQTSEFGSHRKI